MAIDARDFRRAAAREAGRYGGDPLVFLRELLQNARDAGAARISITTKRSDDLEEIEVTDDGQGMTREEAQQFLLTLYASGKSGMKEMAGVFGVGFWSVLVFEPLVIELCSRAAGTTRAWRLALDHDLERIEETSCGAPVGTSVRLVRKRREGDLGRRVWDAVRRDARYLRRREPPDAPLPVFVDGRRATESMRPGVPGIGFFGPGMRGVVTLGDAPELILLAHGLRVRTAASSEDLLMGPGRKNERRWTARSGLWPRVVVDSDRLAVLMARGDVAQDRELERVAHRVDREVRRLYEKELDRLAPLSPLRRLRGRVAANPVRTAGTLAAGLMLVGAAVVAPLLGSGGTMSEPTGEPAHRDGLHRTSASPYRDTSAAYDGPALDRVGSYLQPPQIRYSPVDAKPALGAFRVAGIDEGGRPVGIPGGLRRAAPVELGSGRPIVIEAVVSNRGPIMRLPVPTGHAVDSGSVRLDGRRIELWRTAAGEPVIQAGVLSSASLAYRTVPTRFPSPHRGSWPALPEDVLTQAAPLRRLPPAQRIEGATDLVRRLLSTRVDDETYERLRGARDRGEALIPAILDAGGGDCDVINTVLAAVLDAVGLQVRMAVGWIGDAGRPQPGYHAWVEVDLGGGAWVAADASVAVSQPAAGGRASEVATAPWEAGAAPPGDGGNRVMDRVLMLAVACGCVGVAAAAAFRLRRRRFCRSVVPGVDQDPGRMLEVVLRDRGRPPDFPSARLRPLVPVLEGPRRSLAELDCAAAAGRLFAAAGGGPLAARAVGGGGVVIDTSTRAGTAAASALGARDLDRWAHLQSAAQSSDLTDSVVRALRGHGVDAEVLEVDDFDAPAHSLRLPGEPLLHIAVDREDPEWKVAAELFAVRPREAVFRGVDLLTRTLQEIEGIEARTVGALAQEAVLEASGMPR